MPDKVSVKQAYDITTYRTYMPTIGLSKPPQQAVANALAVNQRAPTTALDAYLADQTKPTLIAFLRHTGCPFAEATVKTLRQDIALNPKFNALIVTHGDHNVATSWLEAIGGTGKLQWFHDPEREVYGQWGLGYTGIGHMLGLPVFKSIRQLRKQGISNRDASGTRWQTAGAFLVDQNRTILWVQNVKTANILPKLEDLKTLVV